jgi:hypothetical protein
LDTNAADYLGSTTTIDHALATGTVAGAAQYFENFGSGDLQGYDADFAPAQTTTAPTDIDNTLANEIVQLNNLYELDGKLADVYGDIAPHTAVGTNVGLDTLPSADVNTTFADLVSGAATNPDTSSADVRNGALAEFFNADNVELYSLLNSGDLLPSGDVIGTALGTSVSTAITDYLQAGVTDLGSFF